MRKSSFGLVMIIAVILTMVVPAVAAELKESQQDTHLDCKKGEEVAVWHFVANQTEGVEGRLVITFPDGSTAGPLPPDKWNKHYTNQHWWVRGPGTPDALQTAQTVDQYGNDLPGKLVISDAYCESVKK